MEKVIRNVSEIDTADRRAIEHLLGRHLAEDQQVIISVVSLDLSGPGEAGPLAPGEVPAWWRVYEGLSEEQADRLDRAVRRRADLTRHPG